MKLETPLFAGLNIKTLNKKRQNPAQKAAAEMPLLKQKSLTQLSHYFNDFITHKVLKNLNRKRIQGIAYTARAALIGGQTLMALPWVWMF